MKFKQICRTESDDVFLAITEDGDLASVYWPTSEEPATVELLEIDVVELDDPEPRSERE